MALTLIWAENAVESFRNTACQMRDDVRVVQTLKAGLPVEADIVCATQGCANKKSAPVLGCHLFPVRLRRFPLIMTTV